MVSIEEMSLLGEGGGGRGGGLKEATVAKRDATHRRVRQGRVPVVFAHGGRRGTVVIVIRRFVSMIHVLNAGLLRQC
jgi:hypothetical protein